MSMASRIRKGAVDAIIAFAEGGSTGRCGAALAEARRRRCAPHRFPMPSGR